MPARRRLLKTLLTPFQSFAQGESSSGLVLIAAAVVAFVWANLPVADAYFHMKEIHIGFEWNNRILDKPLEFWVNDGLMAIFFLLVGLEIKREILIGELQGVRRALWPAVAALGGMVVPAAIYASINWDTAALRGWGIPMATDIAFALGVITLLGKRVPTSLKVFLTALAIVDDLGAVLVIALFYTETLHLLSFAIVLAVFAACLLYGWLHGRNLGIFVLLGLVLWYFMFRSGVHPTVAGVLLAMTIPIPPHLRHPPRESAAEGPQQYEATETALQQEAKELAHLRSPLHRLERMLTPWVAFGIMPIFALFNAGISLQDGAVSVTPVTAGVFFGLLFGKPIGIVGASWLAAKSRMIALPREVHWSQMIGVGILGGIGFTMSLFIAMLAFPQHPTELDQAKLAILATSVVAAAAGLALLLATTPHRTRA